MLRKTYHLQSPDIDKSNMATRLPFWKWHCWKSIGFFPYTKVMCQWILDLIFKAQLKLESGNRKIQYGCQAAIFKVTSLIIHRLLPIVTKKMHMKFHIEIPKQTWVTLRKPCHLQTDGQTDKVNPVYPSNDYVGRGITKKFSNKVHLHFILFSSHWETKNWNNQLINNEGNTNNTEFRPVNNAISVT